MAPVYIFDTETIMYQNMNTTISYYFVEVDVDFEIINIIQFIS